MAFTYVAFEGLIQNPWTKAGTRTRTRILQQTAQTSNSCFSQLINETSKLGKVSTYFSFSYLLPGITKAVSKKSAKKKVVSKPRVPLRKPLFFLFFFSSPFPFSFFKEQEKCVTFYTESVALDAQIVFCFFQRQSEVLVGCNVNEVAPCFASNYFISSKIGIII